MSVMEKPDLLIVATKRANKAASAAAELVERRGGAKENAELQSTVRTQSRVAVSQAQVRIREAVFTREAVSSSPSKVGGRCVSSARRDLCGAERNLCPYRDRPWQELSEVAAALVGCGHVSGLLMRRMLPLAPMLCADWVPIDGTHFKVR
jgi:hypothetical protein